MSARWLRGLTASLVLNADGTYAYIANAAVDPLQVGDQSRPISSTSRSPTAWAAANDHADVQHHRRRRRPGHHRGRRAGLAHGRCRADGRGQWRLRDRRSYRLDRQRRDGRSDSLLGGEFGNYSARLSGIGLPRAGCRDHRRPALYAELLCRRRHRSRAAPRSPCIGMACRFLAQANVALGIHQIHLRRGRRRAGSDDAVVLRFLGRRHRSAGRPDFDLRRRRARRSRRRAEASPSPTSRPAIPTPRASFRKAAAMSERSRSIRSSESGGSGSVGWHFSVDNADIQFLAQGQTLVQTYTVMIDRRPRRHRTRRTSPSRSTAPTMHRPRSAKPSSPTPARTALVDIATVGAGRRTTPIRT